MFKSHDFQKKLLHWYDNHARSLPWRALPGVTPDPYHIWLSEIMLQQTTVQAVISYFLKFLNLWPNVQKLAEAPQEQVLKEWAGLGYYARARNLHKCAQVIVNEHKSTFPNTEADLSLLPGIGAYTSAAIAAIAFNRHSVVIDGNVERVTARIFAIKTPVRLSKRLFQEKAAELYDNVRRSGDFAQSLMDLGATICIPKKPRCGQCPVQKFCSAYKLGIQDSLPAKAPKLSKPQKTGQVFWLEDEKGRVLLERRGEKRMLGGMLAFPTTDWDGKPGAEITVSRQDMLYCGEIYHSFTHFDLKLEIWRGYLNSEGKPDEIFLPKADIKTAGLPTVFLKVAKAMLANEK